IDEYKRDHSLYEAFAPLEGPTVALAVVVENAGFGAEAAAPIARRVLDYLLMGIYPSDEDIALVRQGKVASPVGTPRKVAEMPLPRGLDAFGEDVPLNGVGGAAQAASAASAASAAASAASGARPAASAVPVSAAASSAASSSAARAPLRSASAASASVSASASGSPP
ncbi:MAG: penicillin-binding protein 2, partial [Pseudomonadota bacterium]